MKLSLLLSVLVAATSAVALPHRPGGWRGYGGYPINATNPNCAPSCLTQNDANIIISHFISVLEHTNVTAANATGQRLLADDYVEYSDSIQILQDLPVSGLQLKVLSLTCYSWGCLPLTTSKPGSMGCSANLQALVAVILSRSSSLVATRSYGRTHVPSRYTFPQDTRSLKIHVPSRYTFPQDTRSLKIHVPSRYTFPQDTRSLKIHVPSRYTFSQDTQRC